MKKYYFLIVLALIFGLVLTGCSLLSNIGQAPATEQSGVACLTKFGILDPVLVGLWHFSEVVDDITNDSSGNDNHGTVHGASLDDGQSEFGNALRFDGLDDYVSIDDADILDITDELTIEAWIVADVINTYKSIVVKGDASPTEGIINYGLQIQAEVIPGTLRFFVYYGGSYKFVDSTSLVPADGQWHHVAVTVNTTDDIVKFYIDSLPAGTPTFTASLPVSTSTLEIGRHRHKTLGECQYFNGKIDEVRIWNVALPQEQLGKVYDWAGFFRPVDNPGDSNDVVNVAKAGSAIPVKFSLNGDQGLDIFEEGYPKSILFQCDETDPVVEIDETVTAGGSSLSYDADQYTYVWKTDKSWAGTCCQLVVRLNDGTSHEANFKFK